jgi:hypothetical protein
MVHPTLSGAASSHFKLRLLEHVSMENNRAVNGGALAVAAQSAARPGSITLQLSGSNVGISENAATVSGGAVYVAWQCDQASGLAQPHPASHFQMSLDGQAELFSNTAVNGGAVMLQCIAAADITLQDTAGISRNAAALPSNSADASAVAWGGAIYAQLTSLNVHMSGQAALAGNAAGTGGGAVLCQGILHHPSMCRIVMTGNSSMVDNTGLGAAVYAYHASLQVCTWLSNASRVGMACMHDAFAQHVTLCNFVSWVHGATDPADGTDPPAGAHGWRVKHHPQQAGQCCPHRGLQQQ